MKRRTRRGQFILNPPPSKLFELDRFRPGIGARDTANDLLGYARIYDLRPDVAKTDTTLSRYAAASEISRPSGVAVRIARSRTRARCSRERTALSLTANFCAISWSPRSSW
jgi:hypothetical protein